MFNEPFDILLVEDDEVDIMNVQRAFKKNNITHPLHLARNGVEALEMLRGTNAHKLPKLPKVILLDLNLPKMSGLEFLQKIRSDNSLKNISVFVLTTSSQPSDKVAAHNYNIAGYILKPVSFEVFVNTVATLNAYWEICVYP